MSTALRDLLWSTRPLLVVPDNGLSCAMPAELGGTLTERRYAPDDDALPDVISINARTALERLTSIQEVSMTYDYDAHYHAMRGDHAIGKPLPERDDRWPLWLSVPAIIGVLIVLWSIVTVAGVGARALWEALS